MIREFITQAGVGFFTRIEEDYLENPDAFLLRVYQMMEEYALPIGAFIQWGMNAAERDGNKKHFMSGALMMLEALHRFDAMSGGDAEFFTKLGCFNEKFCTQSGATLCDNLLCPPERPDNFVSFYDRPIDEIFFARRVPLAAFILKYGRGLDYFIFGALAIAELFFRFEEQGLMMPERNLLN